MARGNRIVVSPFPKGHEVEGTIDTGLTPKPGTVVQIKTSAGIDGNGRHTWELYNADADGAHPKGSIIILTERNLMLQGKTVSDAYAAGDRASGYVPLPGDELNLLIKNETGTADDHAFGEILIIDDTTGLFIATTGTPEDEHAQLQEAITDPTADTLAHCIWQK